MASTVIGFYDTETTAQQVMKVLQNSGFSQQVIDFTTGERNSRGVADKLVHAGAPKDEANIYERGIERGGSLVTVTANENEAVKAAEIMQQYEPIYVEALEEWQGTNGAVASTAHGKPMTDSDKPISDKSMSAAPSTMDTDTTRPMGTLDGTETIPIIEEQMRVGKRSVERGGVRVHSYVTEKPVEEQVRLRDETIQVERRPVDRLVSAADVDPFKERSFELTETDEEAVIAKEARVVEEVVVRKDVEERVETVRDTVRRTNVDVQQLNGGMTTEMNQGDFSRYDTDFRTHYSSGSYGSDYTYDQVQPAYRYGYTLSSDGRYKDRNWADVENDVRTNWESSNQGTWDKFKDSIRYAWERARS
jgi:uncharacterized protein (TIGR02271 family)